MNHVHSFTIGILGFLCLTANTAKAATLYEVFGDFARDAETVREIPLPVVGSQLTNATVDTLTFDRVEPNTFNINHFTNLIPENELSFNGIENVNITIAENVNFFGFEFVEPEIDISPISGEPSVNEPFFESVFELSLFDDNQFITSLEFARPNDLLTFVGVGSDIAFNKVQVRETIGTADNEFFGTFYTGTGSTATTPEPPASVPEPVNSAGFLAVLGGFLLKKLLHK